jgi:hypothetical protein
MGIARTTTAWMWSCWRRALRDRASEKRLGGPCGVRTSRRTVAPAEAPWDLRLYISFMQFLSRRWVVLTRAKAAAPRTTTRILVERRRPGAEWRVWRCVLTMSWLIQLRIRVSPYYDVCVSACYRRLHVRVMTASSDPEICMMHSFPTLCLMIPTYRLEGGSRVCRRGQARRDLCAGHDS